MRVKVLRLDEVGVVVRGRRSSELVVPYEEILTAERLRSRRGLDLHTSRSIEPLRLRCRRSAREALESGLRLAGVRVVDCWGAIIAPTLADFEGELARGPASVRQSSDNA